ncbi:MAG: hypothetical protein ACRDTR_02050, partial [Rubrobacter sp.]
MSGRTVSLSASSTENPDLRLAAFVLAPGPDVLEYPKKGVLRGPVGEVCAAGVEATHRAPLVEDNDGRFRDAFFFVPQPEALDHVPA